MSLIERWWKIRKSVSENETAEESTNEAPAAETAEEVKEETAAAGTHVSVTLFRRPAL